MGKHVTYVRVGVATLQHLDDFTQLFRQLAGQSFAEPVGEAAVVPQRLLLGLMKRAQIPLRHRVFSGHEGSRARCEPCLLRIREGIPYPPSAGARDRLLTLSPIRLGLSF